MSQEFPQVEQLEQDHGGDGSLPTYDDLRVSDYRVAASAPTPHSQHSHSARPRKDQIQGELSLSERAVNVVLLIHDHPDLVAGSSGLRNGACCSG